jgi:uncharacterized protein
VLQSYLLPDELELVLRDGAVGLRVRAKPNARRSAILGIEQGALIVALAAPPRDGQANEALVHLLARVASVPKRQVELLRGANARYKLVRIHGVDLEQLRNALLQSR